jgi:hypothetical protein
MSTTNVKSEFVEVITDSNLLTTVTTEPLTAVTTERAIVETPSDSSSSSIPESLTPRQLIDKYDHLFTTHEMYNEFIKQKLSHWKDQTEFRYFDTVYQNHRRTKHTIKRIREVAQTLLEEANQIQITHNKQLTDLYSFMPNITQPHLRKRLGKPELVYPKPRTQIMRQIPPTTIPISSIPTIPQQPGLSTSRPIPTPRIPFPQRPTIIRCFKCNDPNHIKWHCPQYRCQGCRRLSPGHAFRFCPERNYEPDVSYYGHYDHEYGTDFGGSH